MMSNYGQAYSYFGLLKSKVQIRGRCTKKKQKKLTNVSLYVCMSAGNSEMLVFLSVFPQQCTFFKFLMVTWGKKQKNVSF